MCGRTVFTLNKSRVAEVADVPEERVEIPDKCYNAGPTFSLPCIYHDQANRSVRPMVWGLKPRFKTETHLTTNNARTESVTTSKLYSPLINTKRCVLIVDGFYEWKTEGSTKRPFFIANDESMLMAGLYDDLNGDFSFTVLTLEATGKMAEIHERMPLLLERADLCDWLDTNISYDTVSKPLLYKVQELEKQLKYTEVSTIVNSIKNQSSDCMSPKKDVEEKQFQSGLGRFFTKKRKTRE